MWICFPIKLRSKIGADNSKRTSISRHENSESILNEFHLRLFCNETAFNIKLTLIWYTLLSWRSLIMTTKKNTIYLYKSDTDLIAPDWFSVYSEEDTQFHIQAKSDLNQIANGLNYLTVQEAHCSHHWREIDVDYFVLTNKLTDAFVSFGRISCDKWLKEFR